MKLNQLIGCTFFFGLAEVEDLRFRASIGGGGALLLSSDSDDELELESSLFVVRLLEIERCVKLDSSSDSSLSEISATRLFLISEV
mgnify:FL=1